VQLQLSNERLLTRSEGVAFTVQLATQNTDAALLFLFFYEDNNRGVAVISGKNHKRQRRKRESVTAKREKSQTPKFLTAILTLPNLT